MSFDKKLQLSHFFQYLIHNSNIRSIMVKSIWTMFIIYLLNRSLRAETHLGPDGTGSSKEFMPGYKIYSILV